MTLPTWELLLVGALGAGVTYYLAWRDDRITKRGRVLVFDVVVFILFGALITAFVISPDADLPAFFVGAGWTGITSAGVTTAQQNYAKSLKSAT